MNVPPPQGRNEFVMCGLKVFLVLSTGIDYFFVHDSQCFLLKKICLITFLISFKRKVVNLFLNLMIFK